MHSREGRLPYRDDVSTTRRPSLTLKQSQRVARIVREFMREHRLTQIQTSKRLNVSQSQISTIVGKSARRDGSPLVAIETAWRIAKAMAVSVEWLVDGHAVILPPAGVPGWEEAEAQARAELPLPEEAWAMAREARWPGRMTVELAKALATSLYSAHAAEHRAAQFRSPPKPSRESDGREGANRPEG